MPIDNMRMAAFPPYFVGTGANAISLNANNLGNGGVLLARESATITRLGFAMQIKAGTPPTYRISLQSVGADGLPSGTILGATNNAKKTFSPSGYSNYSFNWLTLDETVDITIGQQYAIVIDYSSGTINGSNYMNTNYGMGNFGGSTICDGLEYGLLKNPSWAKVATQKPLVAYGTASDCWGFPLSDGGTARYTASGTISGIKFALPSPFSGGGGTYRLRGVSYYGAWTTGDTLTLRLYSGGGASDTTVIDSVALDSDIVGDSTTTCYRTVVFDGTPPDLNFGDTYRFAFENSDGSTPSFWTVPLSDANDVKALRLGSTFCYTTRGAGNWTDTTTAAPVFYEFLIEAVTPPSSGGAIIAPSVQGLTGLRSY